MSQLDDALVKEVEDYLVNFMVVSPTVLRGGQPDADSLEMLKKAGVRLVVNLRHHSKAPNTPPSTTSFFRRHTDDDEIEDEARDCERVGLRFVNISLDGINAPKMDDIDRFVDLFKDEENLPMYVHCLHGRERTGFMLGAYRLKIQGWTVEEAYKEMLQQGFDPLRTILSDALFEYAKK